MNQESGNCPCGSGLHYEKCCAQKVILDVARRLEQRIGSPDDQRFQEHQQRTQQQMLEAMKQNGMDPAYIYAVEQTGLMVFQETMHLIPPADLDRWNAACQEYERKHSS